jgi:hypothetical protein
MQKFCCGLILLLAAGVLFSCGAKNAEKKFFDIPGYFRGEISYIKSNYDSVIKTTSYNGNTEKKDFPVSEINWEKEFGIFLESDINKPIYYAYLKPVADPGLDTNHHSLSYESVSGKTNITNVQIGFRELSDDDQTNFVSLKIHKSNLINETYIYAIYVKDRQYRIGGTQHIKSLKEQNTFRVDGIFVKK